MDFMGIGLLFVGFLLGGAIGYFFFFARLQQNYLSKEEIKSNYISKDAYNEVKTEFETAKKDRDDKANRIVTLSTQLTKLEGEKNHLNEKLGLIDTELQRLHKLSEQQFKNLANDIFKDKQTTFNTDILDPFKKDIKEFKEKIEDTRKDDIKDITSLKKEIEQLHTLNTNLHNDAQNLTNALQSSGKIQGNWGEDRLKLIFELEGLQEYLDYTSQESYRNDEQALARPDFILRLPDNKHIIIDSKVSLTAYVNYFNATTTEEKSQYLKEHLGSIKSHIDNLGGKTYQSLSGLNTPDYVFLFMPIEAALTLALNEDFSIIEKATQKKIVLVTPTTLIAALKIIKLLWQKEKQVKNIEKIYKESGSLYDKFVGFLEDMEALKKGLDNATGAYDKAMNKLKTSPKKKETIIGKMEYIKELGSQTTKNIPNKFLEEIEVSGDSVVIEAEYSENIKEEL